MQEETYLMASINEVIKGYKRLLEVKYPTHHQTFCSRLKNNPESAKAEAIVFSLMRSNFDKVTLSEDISTGGADFLCISKGIEFIVEVSCVEAESVAAQSGLDEVPKNVSSGWFGMITHTLRTKASSKAAQVSGYNVPRLLVITSEHISANMLIGPYGAETLMTSDTKIEVPIGEPVGKTGLMTDLKNSVFFREKNGSIESCRRSISAILLISIYRDKVYVTGLLHPDPQFKFPITLFRSVPFLRLKKWPPENNQIEMEWVISTPKPAEFYHREVKIKDEELRRI